MCEGSAKRILFSEAYFGRFIPLQNPERLSPHNGPTQATSLSSKENFHSPQWINVAIVPRALISSRQEQMLSRTAEMLMPYRQWFQVAGI